MLKLAIQKSGRLHDGTLQLLEKCGIRLLAGVRKLKTQAKGFPLEVYFLRDDDIPEYVQDGVVDLGIVGQNVVAETGKRVQEVAPLGFADCRLSLAVPQGFQYAGLGSLAGKRIATSYPVILGRFLAERGLQADLHIISGSVELAPSIGLADAILDIVSSGSTLLMNGLREVETIMHSEAALIRGHNLAEPKLALLHKLLLRIEAVNAAARNKYILLNAPNESIERICTLLPGMKSPTILPLALPGWSSLHSVVSEDDFWGVIEELKALGAQGILVIPIEKMVVG
jgi:ATP phosphoribosyltransferase